MAKYVRSEQVNSLHNPRLFAKQHIVLVDVRDTEGNAQS